MIRRLSLAALAVATLAACSAVPPAPGPGGQTITVPAERVAECRKQGGCFLVSRAELLGALEEARDVGAAQTCRKGSAL